MLFEKYEKGYQLIELGKFEAAREVFSSILAKNADDFHAYRMIAMTYVQESDFRNAIKPLDRAIELEADDSSLYYLKSKVCLGLDDTDEAAYFAEKAIDFEPDNSEYHLQAGLVYLEQSILGKSMFHIDKAIELDPDSGTAHGVKAIIFSQVDNQLESKASLEKALELDPENAFLVQQKVGEYFNDHKIEQSSVLLEQMIINDPSNWLLREQFLDTELSKNILYYWLVVKLNLFRVLNYAVMIFDVCFIAFVAAMLRSKNSEESYYPIIKLVFISLCVFRLLQWSVRLIGHLYKSKKIWKLRFRDFFTANNLIMCNLVLAYLFAIMHERTLDFVFLATAVVLVLMSFYILCYLFSEKKKVQTLLIWLLVGQYGIGLLNFFSQYYWLSWSSFLAKANTFIIVLPFIAVVFYGFVLDFLKKKPKLENKHKAKSENKNSWLFIYFYIFIFGVYFLYAFFAWRIFPIYIPIIIYSIIGIAAAVVGTIIMRKKNPDFFNPISQTQTSDEVYGKIIGFELLIVVAVVLLGFGIQFLSLGSERQTERCELVGVWDAEKNYKRTLKVKIGESNHKLEMSKAEIELCYEQGYVSIKTKKSFFGVLYIDEIISCTKD